MNYLFFPTDFHFFHMEGHSNHFFSMKMAESGKIVLVTCIIEFYGVQVSLRRFGLNVNACKVMRALFKLSGQIFNN